MPSLKRKFGDLGEKIAEHYLIGKGYGVIEKNYQKPWGEIDLVCRKQNRIVFVEVKTREKKNVEHFLAESAVNKGKIRKLQKICETYLSEKKYAYSQEWQIDVLAIYIEKENKKARVNHIENAIFDSVY